jgi:hypothetical protein
MFYVVFLMCRPKSLNDTNPTPVHSLSDQPISKRGAKRC